MLVSAVRDTGEWLSSSASFAWSGHKLGWWPVSVFPAFFSVFDLKQHKLIYQSTDPGSTLAPHYWLLVYNMTQPHHHQELLLHLYKFDFKFFNKECLSLPACFVDEETLKMRDKSSLLLRFPHFFNPPPHDSRISWQPYMVSLPARSNTEILKYFFLLLTMKQWLIEEMLHVICLYLDIKECWSLCWRFLTQNNRKFLKLSIVCVMTRHKCSCTLPLAIPHNYHILANWRVALMMLAR